MNIRKAFAIAVSVGVLGVQFWAIMPPGDASWKSWYWPFMDYPMYSRPHYAGEVFVVHQLRGIRCGAPPDTLVISNWHLRTGSFWLYRVLRQAAGPASADPDIATARMAATPDSAALLLSSLMRTQIRDSICEAQLWEQAFILGTTKPYHEEVPWNLLRTWEVAESTPVKP